MLAIIGASILGLVVVYLVIHQILRAAFTRSEQAKAELVSAKGDAEDKIKRRTEQLLSALKEVQDLYSHDHEVQQLKDMFVTIASHELRTPLTVLKGHAEFLHEVDLPAEATEIMVAIDHSIERLNLLSEELINIASIEKGQLKPLFRPTTVAELVAKVGEENLPAADRKKLELKYHSEATLGELNLDSRLIGHALNNLIDNAIKFSKTGAIELSARCKGDQLEFVVSDQGPGISAAEQAKLFTKFGKIEPNGAGFVEGHGLGLYLTKLIASAHHGNISVGSNQKGSTFILSLPLDLPVSK